MDKKIYNKLFEVETANVTYAFASELRDGSVAIDHGKAVAAAYVLLQNAENGTSIFTPADFDSLEGISLDVKEAVLRQMGDNWNLIEALSGKFSSEELKAFILFNNQLEDYKRGDCSTPDSVLKLACELLDISDDDRVLELCSGKGNFMISAFGFNEKASYSGVELNFDANDIAVIRTSLLGENFNVCLNDALEYRAPEKATKLFANYPFRIKTPSLAELKMQMADNLSIPVETIKRAPSDWIFNALLVEQMEVNGKAVAIMTNGSTWNKMDKDMRKFFVENGLIETVISLPSKLFDAFSIPTTMIVFSRNNEKIKLVDAKDFCGKVRTKNVISYENILEILQAVRNEGDTSTEKTNAEIAENDYVLNAVRYLESIPEIKNGVELGSVIKSITRGNQLKAKELDELKSTDPTAYQYLTLANVNNGIVSFDSEQYLTGIPENMKKYCVPNNAIVLSKIGMPAFKSAVVQVENGKFVLSTGNLFVIEIDETKANPYYIQSFFASDTGVASFNRIYNGASIHTISLGSLKKMMIPLPDIETQNEIGNKYATAADELILLKRKVEKITAKLAHIYDEEE